MGPGRRVGAAGPRRLEGAVSGDKVPKPQRKANPPKTNNGPGQAWSVVDEAPSRPRGGGVGAVRQGRPAP
ncbi:hypothetical protein GCM10010177_05860 [Actinomadura citrea]|nr:hypothetical protein GCM10010177_05860 [Actinomadura citrea]